MTCKKGERLNTMCLDMETLAVFHEACQGKARQCIHAVVRGAARMIKEDRRVLDILISGASAKELADRYAQDIARAIASVLTSIISQLPPGTTVGTINLNIESVIKSVVNEVKESIINELNTVYVNKALVKVELSATERAELRESLKLISDVLLQIIYSGGDEVAASKLVSMDVLERYYKKLLDLSRRIEKRLGVRVEDIAKSKSRDAPYADVTISALRTLENLIHIRKEGSSEERAKRYKQVKPMVIDLVNQIKHVMTTYVN